MFLCWYCIWLPERLPQSVQHSSPLEHSPILQRVYLHTVDMDKNEWFNAWKGVLMMSWNLAECLEALTLDMGKLLSTDWRQELQKFSAWKLKHFVEMAFLAVQYLVSCCTISSTVEVHESIHWSCQQYIHSHSNLAAWATLVTPHFCVICLRWPSLHYLLEHVEFWVVKEAWSQGKGQGSRTSQANRE